MSVSILMSENIKEKAKLLRALLKEKNDVDITHGRCIEILSQLFGFKDWNTASAKLKSKAEPNIYPMKVKTVGDLKRALAPYDDSASVHADYTFKLRDFLNDIDPDEELEPNSHRYQEFSMRMDKFNDDLAIFELVLKEESLGW